MDRNVIACAFRCGIWSSDLVIQCFPLLYVLGRKWRGAILHPIEKDDLKKCMSVMRQSSCKQRSNFNTKFGGFDSVLKCKNCISTTCFFFFKSFFPFGGFSAVHSDEHPSSAKTSCVPQCRHLELALQAASGEGLLTLPQV